VRGWDEAVTPHRRGRRNRRGHEMDWIGWAFVLVVVVVAVGLLLERRRRAARLGGPEHSEEHRGSAPSREGAWQDEVRPPDSRNAGYFGDSV